MAQRRALLPAALLAAACLACAAALTAVAGKAEAAFPGKNGRIAFHASFRTEGSNYQIFTIAADGTDEKQLTDTSARAYNITPSYSADGRKITWERNGDIWVMDADGSHKRRVTSTADGAHDHDPVFGPGGRRVAFVRHDPEEGQGDIYTKGLRSGDLRRVTDDEASELSPRYSPRGGTIAFVRGVELATVRTDGTGLEVITDTPGQRGVSEPDWSPDGRTLVFVTYEFVHPNRQWPETVRADGTRRRSVSAPERIFAAGSPVFSPDGTKIAFARGPGSPYVYWTIDADGAGTPTPVAYATDPERVQSGPSWGPKPTAAR